MLYLYVSVIEISLRTSFGSNLDKIVLFLVIWYLISDIFRSVCGILARLCFCWLMLIISCTVDAGSTRYARLSYPGDTIPILVLVLIHA